MPLRCGVDDDKQVQVWMSETPSRLMRSFRRRTRRQTPHLTAWRDRVITSLRAFAGRLYADDDDVASRPDQTAADGRNAVHRALFRMTASTQSSCVFNVRRD